MLPNIEAWIQSLGFLEVGATKKRRDNLKTKFEMRTVEGLSRFLTCPKGFRNVLPDKGRAGYQVPMKNFEFPIAGVDFDIQKRWGRESGKVPNVKTPGDWKQIH